MNSYTYVYEIELLEGVTTYTNPFNFEVHIKIDGIFSY